MGTFLRASITDDTFLKGAARIVYAAEAQAFPTKISDMVVLSAGGTQYDTAAGWSDLGATRGGISITRNNTEETYEVDQIPGEIESSPTGWEMSVQTQIAEMVPAMLDLAWELGTPTASSPGVPDGNLTLTGMGTPTKYTRRRMAVLHQRNNLKIRAYVFRKAQRSAQESAVAHNKAGEQQSVPVRFRCLADTSVASEDDRFGTIIDQS